VRLHGKKLQNATNPFLERFEIAQFGPQLLLSAIIISSIFGGQRKMDMVDLQNA
jgi:hypothetical protein